MLTRLWLPPVMLHGQFGVDVQMDRRALILACLPAFGSFLRDASPGSLHGARQCLVMTADGWILLQSTPPLQQLLNDLERRLQAQVSLCNSNLSSCSKNMNDTALSEGQGPVWTAECSLL